MFSAPTLHVITTELTVGMFSLSGICFLLIFIGKGPEVKDSDRKSTRLNSSHVVISYAVFCLKKKNPKP